MQQAQKQEEDFKEECRKEQIQVAYNNWVKRKKKQSKVNAIDRMFDQNIFSAGRFQGDLLDRVCALQGEDLQSSLHMSISQLKQSYIRKKGRNHKDILSMSGSDGLSLDMQLKSADTVLSPQSVQNNKPRRNLKSVIERSLPKQIIMLPPTKQDEVIEVLKDKDKAIEQLRRLQQDQDQF